MKILLFSNSPSEDLDSRIDFALRFRSRSERRRFATRNRDSNPLARNPNFQLLRFQFPNLYLHLRLQLDLQRQTLALHARFQCRRVGAGVNRGVRARDRRLERRHVPLRVRERRENTVADIDAAGEDPDGGLVVEEGDVAVPVAGDEGDVEGGGDGGVGEVESGELEGGDGEGGAVGAVDEVEDAAGDGGDEEDEED